MENVQSMTAARAAARAAQERASAERNRREQMNVEDLATFMVAVGKLGSVDEWAGDRIEQLRARIVQIELEADRRRQDQRVIAGSALQAMRDRGEAVSTIAELAGVSETQVRAYLEVAGAGHNGGAAQNAGAGPSGGAAQNAAAAQTSDAAQPGQSDPAALAAGELVGGSSYLQTVALNDVFT